MGEWMKHSLPPWSRTFFFSAPGGKIILLCFSSCHLGTLTHFPQRICMVFTGAFWKPPTPRLLNSEKLCLWNVSLLSLSPLLKRSERCRQGKFSAPLRLCQLYNESVGLSLFPNLDPLKAQWRLLNSSWWLPKPFLTFKDYRFFWVWWVVSGSRKFHKTGCIVFDHHVLFSSNVVNLESTFHSHGHTLEANISSAFQRGYFISGWPIALKPSIWLLCYMDFLNCFLMIFAFLISAF